MAEDKKIGVGFGVMLLKDNKVLLGKRHDDPEKARSALGGAGTWTMPGGKLRFGESFEEGATREVMEETGINLAKENLEIINVNNDIIPEAHFITLGILCQQFEGEAQVREPEEITKWEWFNLDELPSPLYFPSEKVLKAYIKKSKGNGIFSELNSANYQNYDNPNFKNVFLSIPSSLFYQRTDISAFALQQNTAPLNPYMNFDYNIFNTAPKQSVRIANNALISKADEVWVFATNFNGLSDGVVAEIFLAKEYGKPLRYFRLPDFKEIKEEVDTRGIEDYYGIKLKDISWKTCYTAMSSKLFYYKSFISKYALEKSYVPLNPFMSFDYFLVDRVARNSILFANSNFVNLGDELWIFGAVSDGVLAEIKLARQKGKPIKYFEVSKTSGIKEISKEEVEFEEGVSSPLSEL